MAQHPTRNINYAITPTRFYLSHSAAFKIPKQLPSAVQVSLAQPNSHAIGRRLTLEQHQTALEAATCPPKTTNTPRPIATRNSHGSPFTVIPRSPRRSARKPNIVQRRQKPQ